MWPSITGGVATSFPEYQERKFFNSDYAAVNLLKGHRNRRYNKITFKVLDVAKYYRKDSSFKYYVKNIFKPTAIILAFCYSNADEGDVKEALKQIYRPQNIVVNRRDPEVSDWNAFDLFD